MKNRLSVATLVLAAALLAGCATAKRLPSEDIEVPVIYTELITALKNPDIRANSREKYEAARQLIKKVDFTFTRETKTIDQLLYHGDAIIDAPSQPDRTIAFNYQYGDHYVRLTFYTFEKFVVRTDVQEK